MNTDGFDQWSKISKNILSPITDLNNISAKMCSRLTQEYIDLVSTNSARLTEHLDLMKDVKKPEEFFAMQKECISDCMNSAIENLQKISKIYTETFEQCANEFVKNSGTPLNMAKNMAKETEKNTR